jgi:hypothetical protein
MTLATLPATIDRRIDPWRTSHLDRPAVRFIVHVVEMIVVMLVGMAVTDLAVGPLYAALGYRDPMRQLPLASVLVMAAQMTGPMALWMRLRGHPSRHILEMSIAMIAPAAALIAAAAGGLVANDVVHAWYHPAMYLAMVGQMALRRNDHASHTTAAVASRKESQMSASATVLHRAIDTNRWVPRLGALAGLVGLPLQVLVSSFHPGRTDPNDSAAVFLEYAAAPGWTLVHIGQFFGTLLITLGLLAIYRSLAPERGLTGALSLTAGVALAVVLAVFAVQMAVDGVALKHAIDAWVAAAPADRSATFAVAESVRWLEKGLSAFFHLANGTALLTLGAAMATSSVYPRLVGLLGVAAGVGFLGGGVTTAHTGFSAAASGTLSSTLPFLVAFVVSASVAMWRRSR